jgi:phosphate starvation-inducible protein PhoH
MESFNRTRLSKKEKRYTRQEKKGLKNQAITFAKPQFTIQEIDPLTENQEITFDAYEDGKHLMLHGIAGTGKTFISLYLAFRELLSEDSQYNKICIVRSVVPSRDMGFLPGTASEKAKVYEAPYYAICTELFGKSTAYDAFKAKGQVEFITTSFIRGITLKDCIVVVDEAQNLCWSELSTIMTRIGKNCRIVFCGDYRQTDFTNDKDKSGLHQFMKVLKQMRNFEFVDFQPEDIVRSDIVKEFIIAADRLGYNM